MNQREIDKLREELGDAIEAFHDDEATAPASNRTAAERVTCELQLLQNIHRSLYLLRARLIEGRYVCDCGSAEGEFHGGACRLQAAFGLSNIVRRWQCAT